MISHDVSSRVLAAGFGIGGLGYMMTRSGPTVEGILIGLSCLVLCTGFSLVPNRQKPTRARQVQKAMPLIDFASADVERDVPVRATGQLQPALLTNAGHLGSKLPELPTHRQRIINRKLVRGQKGA